MQIYFSIIFILLALSLYYQVEDPIIENLKNIPEQITLTVIDISDM